MRVMITLLCSVALLAACAPAAESIPTPTLDPVVEALLDTRCDDLSILEAATDEPGLASGLSISVGMPALPLPPAEDCDVIPLENLIPPAPADGCYLRTDGLLQAPSLFAGPDVVGEPVATLPQGEWLPVLAISADENYQVRLEDGTQAWIEGSIVRLYGMVQGLCEGLPQTRG